MRSEPVSRFRVLTAALMLELAAARSTSWACTTTPFSKSSSVAASLARQSWRNSSSAATSATGCPSPASSTTRSLAGRRALSQSPLRSPSSAYGGLCLCAMHPPTAPSSAYTVLLGVLFFCWGTDPATSTALRSPRQHTTSLTSAVAPWASAKALYGLSGSLLTQVYQAFFNREPVGAHFPGFLAFQALFLSGLGASMIRYVRLVDSTDSMAIADKPRRRLKTGACVIIVLALALAAVGLLRSFTSLGKPPYAAQFSYAVFAMSVVGVLALWSMAWGASVSASDHALLPKDPADCAPIDDGGDASPAPLINASAQEEARTHTSDGAVATATEEDLHTSPPPPLPPSGGAMAPLTNGTLMANVRSLNFWLIFVAFFGGAGTGWSSRTTSTISSTRRTARRAPPGGPRQKHADLAARCAHASVVSALAWARTFQHHVTRPSSSRSRPL